MLTITTEMEGWKLVGYLTGKIRPGYPIDMGDPEPFQWPDEPENAYAVMHLRAFPPIYDHNGEVCTGCLAANEVCQSRHGLRATEALPLALFDTDGKPLPHDLVTASAGIAGYDPRFLYRVGERARPKLPPDPNQTHPHWHGIHFFRTREEVMAYRLQATPTPTPASPG